MTAPRASAGVDWAAVIAADMAMPADQTPGELIALLTTMLADPDAAVRDGTAYPILATWILRGHLDDQLASLGETMVATLRHRDTQARTFAALILATVVRRDAVAARLDAEVVRRWRESFAAWWVGEQDIRGYDDTLGWLHAVAHGADVVRAFATTPQSDAEDLGALLDAVTRRLLAPNPYRFTQFEAERLAYAIAITLCRPEIADPLVSDGDARVSPVAWIEPLRLAIDAGEPGPSPAWAANTIDTLTCLYVYVHRGVRAYEPATGAPFAATVPASQMQIAEAIADVLRLPAYWLE